MPISFVVTTETKINLPEFDRDLQPLQCISRKLLQDSSMAAGEKVSSMEGRVVLQR